MSVWHNHYCITKHRWWGSVSGCAFLEQSWERILLCSCSWTVVPRPGVLPLPPMLWITVHAATHGWSESGCKNACLPLGSDCEVCPCVTRPRGRSLDVLAATQHILFAEFSCLSTEKFPSRRGPVQSGISTYYRKFRSSDSCFVSCKKLCPFTILYWIPWIIYSYEQLKTKANKVCFHERPPWCCIVGIECPVSFPAVHRCSTG